MDKKIVEAVIERSQGLCELCGNNQMVQLHHIISGQGKRKQCETVESVKALCWTCHHGTFGVHGREGKALDRQLRQELEKTYRDQGLEEQEILYLLGGRYYLGVD